MPQFNVQHLNAVSAYLNTRRRKILEAWQKAGRDDPEQTTARALTCAQLKDHIPQVLDAFIRGLQSQPSGGAANDDGTVKQEEDVKHGLHRWQQGYRLQELMHEWGHLHRCLFEELETFAMAHPDFDHETRGEVHRRILALINDGISESTGQYQRMQQAEAASHLGDLKAALSSMSAAEHRRAVLIHQAVHDIGSNVSSVNMAAHLLGRDRIDEVERLELTTLLQTGVTFVSEILGDLMELARLEAGQERRELATFDAAELITELCRVNELVARDRGLFLNVSGPRALVVDGDSSKVRRLLQNLVRNAVKYTEFGGVDVSYGDEKTSWWLMIKDTGPGILAGAGGPMLAGLKEATASARESDEITAKADGTIAHVLNPPSGVTVATRAIDQQPGEGIGLSIVKRLCELLDASIELTSSAEAGTTFRVVLPRTYAAPRPTRFPRGASGKHTPSTTLRKAGSSKGKTRKRAGAVVRKNNRQDPLEVLADWRALRQSTVGFPISAGKKAA